MTAAETNDRAFFGHPRGLSTLFFTEMWERFSYYGMRAFLILYMVTPAEQGGLGFSDPDAASIYGTYTGSVWGAAILGGIVADRFLGQYRSVLIGGIIIALGHFTLAFKALPFFYTGLGLIVVGTGLLEAERQHASSDRSMRRATRGATRGSRSSTWGSTSAPSSGRWLPGTWRSASTGTSASPSAGVGMAFGVAQYVLGRKRLQPAVERLAAQPATAAHAGDSAGSAAASSSGWLHAPRSGSASARSCILFVFATLFWGGTNRPARRSISSPIATRGSSSSASRSRRRGSRSVQPIFVILFAPVFAWLWMRLGAARAVESRRSSRWRSSSCRCRSWCSCRRARWRRAAAAMRVSPMWLIVAYAISELGELCLSPVGLSAVTKLAPVRIVGLMMGVWFLSNSFGNKLAGSAAGYISSMPLQTLFGVVAGVLAAAAVVMFAIVKPMQRLMRHDPVPLTPNTEPWLSRNTVRSATSKRRPSLRAIRRSWLSGRRSAKPAAGLFFCVQKHLASHLHYDFRLEHNGVLLSWAVPKGPSLDPKTKRLAMHVEDHPFEYGTFEGVIPEGYGAGIVMLWDQGTWTPESDDVDAALKKGDLKFTLDGYKLKGSWVLVRTGGRFGSCDGGDGARSWLLIKHRDDWAGDVDITEFAPRSVKSDGDFEDILAADNPDVWVSNRPAKGGETGAMLATIIKKAAATQSRCAAPQIVNPSAAPRKRQPAKQTGETSRSKESVMSTTATKAPRKSRTA